MVLASAWHPRAILAYFQGYASPFEKFTLILLLMLLMPPLFERLRLPGVVGPLLGGVLLGPYAFAIVPPDAPIIDLFASVGRVFLMFIAGLEIDMRVFNATRQRSMGFGAATFAFPLLGATGGVVADDPAAVRGQLRDLRKETLELLYRENPKAKTQIRKAAGHKGGSAGEMQTPEGITIYQLTETGLMAKGTVQGTKYWRDEELN